MAIGFLLARWQPVGFCTGPKLTDAVLKFALHFIDQVRRFLVEAAAERAQNLPDLGPFFLLVERTQHRQAGRQRPSRSIGRPARPVHQVLIQFHDAVRNSSKFSIDRDKKQVKAIRENK